MITGRPNALEIDGRTARRFAVVTYQLAGEAVVDAVLAPEPAEEFTLPLERETALRFVFDYLYDLPGREQLELVELLTRPTGPLVGGRTTGPLG